jgi:hypothetical protein
VQADGHERPRLFVAYRLQFAGPQGIATPLAQLRNPLHDGIGSTKCVVGQHAVVVLNPPAQAVGIDQVIPGQAVHPGRQLRGSCGRDELRGLGRHLPHQAVVGQQQVQQEAEQLMVDDTRVVFGTGDGQFLRRNLPVEHLPGVWVRGDLPAHLAGVEPGDHRRRPDRIAVRRQP